MPSLQQRLQELEDIEAIRKLKAAYCDACDDDHNGTAVAALFSEQGSWQVSGKPPCVGRQAIADYMFAVRDRGGMRCSAHLVSNPDIEVSGNQASGRWRLLMLFSSSDGNHFYRIIGRYRETYVRLADRWLFQSLIVDIEERGSYQATTEV